MNTINKRKFVIVGQGRCGSNLLKFSLKQHQAVSVVGELFNKNVYSDVFDVDGAERASRYYERELSKDPIMAAGFKLFSHQATRKPAKSIWRYLVKEGVSVIHLERKNKVDRLVSLEIANSTGAFLKRSENDAYKVHQVDRPVGWWREMINKDYEVERQLEKHFLKNPYIHVYYEDLVDQWSESIAKIQHFLDVPVQIIEKAIGKQEFKPKSERIANYKELSGALCDTAYGWMF